MNTNENLYESDDIVLKPGAARMFGVDGTNEIHAVNYLMKKGLVPPYDGYIGGRGFWRRQTLRDARDATLAAAADVPINAPPRRERSVVRG